MEYRTLENIDSICIYEAFTQAFSDYQVSVDMSFKSFETMLKRNGFMPAVSVGAFVDKTLVAFICTLICRFGLSIWHSSTNFSSHSAFLAPALLR